LGASVGIGDDDVTSIFDEVGANSQKIAITKSDGETQIYAEIERWDSGNELAEIWVSKSDLVITATGDYVLYIYYDNTHADNTDYIGTTAGSSPATNVWDSDYKAVYHKEDLTTSSIADSIGSYNGTKIGANEPIEADGVSGKAQQYDGSNDRIDMSDSADWDFSTGAFTLETWHYSAGTTNSLRYMSAGSQTDGAYNSWAWGRFVGDGSINFIVWNGSGYDEWYQDSYPTELSFTDNTWIHSVVVRDGTSLKMYWNGVLVTDGSIGVGVAINGGSTGLRIGMRYRADVADVWEYWNGRLDEVRVSKGVGRNAAWIKADYNSGNDSLVTWGSEEEVTVTTAEPQMQVIIIN